MTEQRQYGDGTARVERAIVQRLQEGAAEWFPGVPARATVRLQLVGRRPRALLYSARVGSRATPLAVAKVRLPGAVPGIDTTPRPRLAPTRVSIAEQTAREFTGLRALYARFGTGADGRFGAVRPLDLLASEHTILMEYVDAPTLRAALAGESRFTLPRQRGTDAAAATWTAAGAWLRQFHDSVQLPGLASRQATVDEVVERFDAYAEYLGDRVGRRAGLLARRGGALAAQVLPERLALATGHGDFAPRNVFVDGRRRIIGFDPMPRWRVPVHEDLSRFLVAIRLVGAQLHSHGAAYPRRRLEQRERAVIDGYWSDGPVPDGQLRCYQLLVLLDKWSALLGAASSGRGATLRNRSVLLATGFVQDEAHRLLELVEDSSGNASSDRGSVR